VILIRYQAQDKSNLQEAYLLKKMGAGCIKHGTDMTDNPVVSAPLESPMGY
jgi:hypothetical protein